MELRQLRYFVSIVDLGSFTKAAEVLFITQPTLSWNIRKLEEEFGVTLLDRHFNGVQLTEMGTILYEGSRRNLDLVDSLQSHMHNETRRIPQEITLGISGIASLNYMARIEQFNKDNQPLEIKQVIAGSNYIQEHVMNGDMDVGIVVSPEKRDHLKVNKITLQESHYPTAFVVHKDSKYAGATSLAIDILKDEDFASLSKNYKIVNGCFLPMP